MPSPPGFSPRGTRPAGQPRAAARRRAELRALWRRARSHRRRAARGRRVAPGHPVPGQLAGLCARLGIDGHGITAPPAGDLPERWHNMLTPAPRPQRRRARHPGRDRGGAARAGQRHDRDRGLHHGERGTIMHLLATGVTLEDDWQYARGVRPPPMLWIRDSDGGWHATRLDSVSPWGITARTVD